MNNGLTLDNFILSRNRCVFLIDIEDRDYETLRNEILDNQLIIERIKGKLCLYKNSADPVEIILTELLATTVHSKCFGGKK